MMVGGEEPKPAIIHVLAPDSGNLPDERTLEQSIYERRCCGRQRGKNYESRKDYQNYNYWSEPKFLSDFHKIPELFNKRHRNLLVVTTNAKLSFYRIFRLFLLKLFLVSLDTGIGAWFPLLPIRLSPLVEFSVHGVFSKNPH